MDISAKDKMDINLARIISEQDIPVKEMRKRISKINSKLVI